MMPALRSLLIQSVVVALATMPAMAQQVPPPGALACGGCHPARAMGPVVPLNALGVAGIVEAMQAFRSGAREATVMDRIAKGFSDEETLAIAQFYARQVKP